MPTYTYKCLACGHVEGRIESIMATPRRRLKCPECGARRLERQIGRGGGVIIRGDGPKHEGRGR